MSQPNCPKCQSSYSYLDAQLWICPECSHEWSSQDTLEDDTHETVIKDANGQVLSSGDSVTVVKDLKIKGSSQVVKVGMKVKNIRLLSDASDGHNIDCKIEGIGQIKLKAEYVKKV